MPLHSFGFSFSAMSYMNTSGWRLCETDVTEIEQGTRTPHGWANWTDQLISFPGPLPSFSHKSFRKPPDQLLRGIRFPKPLCWGWRGRWILTVCSVSLCAGDWGGYSLSAFSPSVLGAGGATHCMLSPPILGAEGFTHCLLSLWISVFHKFHFFFQIQELRIHSLGWFLTLSIFLGHQYPNQTHQEPRKSIILKDSPEFPHPYLWGLLIARPNADSELVVLILPTAWKHCAINAK